MDDADRSTVGAMHDGPAIKNRAVRDQFQQHCVRGNSQQFRPTATDHGSHVMDEGMIHGGLYGLIQVRSQRPDACSPPSARVTTPARDPVPSGTLHHGHNRYRIHSPWNDHAVVPSPNPLHRHGTSEKRIRRRPATTFEELIPVLSTRFQTNLASIRASRSSFSLTGGDEVASRVADSVGVPGSGAG